jgi:hypothetical protein
MKLLAGKFCLLYFGAFLLMFPSQGAGQDDPTKPRVTLTVTRIRGLEYSVKELEGELKGQNVRHVTLACDAVIDNQTGEELLVQSSLYSAFDGLSVQILRDGRKVGEQRYSSHQSPTGAIRFFILKKGKNEKELRIPFRLPPEDWAKLQARLVGDLPGSAFKGKLESKSVPIQRVETLEP